LENPRSFAGDGQGVEGDSGEDRDMSDAGNNWKSRPLGELATTTSGGTPSRARKDYYGGSIPWVKSGELNDDYIFDTEEHITEAGLKNSSAKVFSSGTILIALYGATVGKTSILRTDASTNQAVCGITPGPDLDAGYLRFHLISLRRELLSHRYGGAQPNISQQIVRNQKIAYPPLPEQKKIAHILSTVQRAIEAQERIIQTTTELKKALMHKLFTEGLCHEPQKQTEIGPVPESWEVVHLGEFFQIKHGYAFDGKFFKPSGDHILMTPGHFHEEGGFREQGEKTKYFKGEIPQDYVLAKDDLVVAMTEQTSGLLGSAAFVPEGDLYLHNQRLGLIVDLDEKRLSKRFLFYLFNHPHLRVEVAKTSTGSKVKHTSPTKLRAVKVGIPPSLDEQEEIASALSTTQQKISVATNKKSQLQDLFRTLLNELMTAKIRVHELDFSTGEHPA
jgi:type I restriction enzyme S subunit